MLLSQLVFEQALTTKLYEEGVKCVLTYWLSTACAIAKHNALSDVAAEFGKLLQLGTF